MENSSVRNEGPTTVYLTADIAQRARIIAEAKGVKTSKVVREALNSYADTWEEHYNTEIIKEPSSEINKLMKVVSAWDEVSVEDIKERAVEFYLRKRINEIAGEVNGLDAKIEGNLPLDEA